MRIGILAVQGAFIEHRKMLEALGAECVELRSRSDIKALDGLVLPGGESTVQGKLLRELDMFEPLKELIENGLPTLATCAGLILLAETISNDDNVYFATMPITVQRNAYGRQLGSFRVDHEFKGIGEVPMTFIRAPYIESLNTFSSDYASETNNPISYLPKMNTLKSAAPEILAIVDDKIVAARFKNQIGLAFHPELDADTRIHKMFLELITGNQ